MTAREALKNLNKLSKAELDLPLIAICGSSGVSYGLTLYGDVRTADGGYDAGPLIDMEGEQYIWAHLD